MTNLIIVTDDGPIRLIRMNRPEKKNALTAPMYAAMADAIESADKTIHCILIAGGPAAFCAGNDLQDFLATTQSGPGGGLGEPVIRFLHALARCEKPLVAAVQGVAIGVGTTMLLHCDYAVAAADARFSTPFVQLGLVPEAASSLLAPRLMGHRRAFSLLVMGEPLDAQGAKACGLVNAVVAPEETEVTAREAAVKIASLPPRAVATTRTLMRGPVEDIVARIGAEADAFRIRLQSPEARSAFEAFFARKKK